MAMNVPLSLAAAPGFQGVRGHSPAVPGICQGLGMLSSAGLGPWARARQFFWGFRADTATLLWNPHRDLLGLSVPVCYEGTLNVKFLHSGEENIQMIWSSSGWI